MWPIQNWQSITLKLEYLYDFVLLSFRPQGVFPLNPPNSISNYPKSSPPIQCPAVSSLQVMDFAPRIIAVSPKESLSNWFSGSIHCQTHGLGRSHLQALLHLPLRL